MPDALTFDVRDTVMDRGGWLGKWPGIVRPRLQWTTHPHGLAEDKPGAEELSAALKSGEKLLVTY